METVNAFGLACPKPLMMAKAKIDEGARELSVHVDNEIIEGGWSVNFSEGDRSAAAAAAPAAAPACTPAGCGYAVFIGKDHVGEGDPQLGYNLMKMAIYTLSESEDVPASVLFMNSGVKLVAGDEQQIIDSVNKLIKKGTEVLVCGTCLDFYGLKEQLKVGEVSNMYDILGRMQEAAKTITL